MVPPLRGGDRDARHAVTRQPNDPANAGRSRAESGARYHAAPRHALARALLERAEYPCRKRAAEIALMHAGASLGLGQKLELRGALLDDGRSGLVQPFED